MTRMVSSRWLSVVALLSLVSVLSAVFIPFGFPGTGAVATSLVLAAALWVRVGSGRPVTQIVDDVDAEPVTVIEAPVRLGIPAPRSVY